MSKTLYRINCGSPQTVTGPDGTVWEGDYQMGSDDDSGVGPGGWCCVGGSPAPREPDLPLYPPAYADLLRHEGFAMKAYRFSVHPGTYTIRLVLAETHETLSTLTRSYTLAINGLPLDREVRPFEVAGGHGTAGILTVRGITVDADELCLDFGEKANVYGIEVISTDSEPFSVDTQTLASKAVEPVPRADSARDIRVLFIGHSGTFFWAIPETVARMVNVGHPSVYVHTDAVYHGGKGVDFFYRSEKARAKLGERTWDYVVVQDSSWGPIKFPETFKEYMPKLLQLVRDHGAQPLLYAYGGPLSNSAEDRQYIMDLYAAMGREHSVPVVPCLAAQKVVLLEDPEQNYHNPDRHHTGMMAGYLYAAVWYRALTGCSAHALPEHTTLGGHVTVPEEKAAYLSDVADRVCREHGIGTSTADCVLTGYLESGEATG